MTAISKSDERFKALLKQAEEYTRHILMRTHGSGIPKKKLKDEK